MTQLRTPQSAMPGHTRTRLRPPRLVVGALGAAAAAVAAPLLLTGGITFLLGFGLLAHLLLLGATLRPRPRPNPLGLSGVTGLFGWTAALMYLTIADAGVMLPLFALAALAIGALAMALARWSPVGAVAGVLIVACDALTLDHLTGDGLGLPWQFLLAGGCGGIGLVLAAATLSLRRSRRAVQSLACGA